MQTFLPYPDFEKTAKTLDWRRLGKQRVEAFQILNVLLGRTNKAGWRNHPAVLMWKGYEGALKHYMNIMIQEWISRGYRNTMRLEHVEFRDMMPPWLGLDEFHASHRSNLLRKDPKFYGTFGWLESSDLPYFWPVSKEIKNDIPRVG